MEKPFTIAEGYAETDSSRLVRVLRAASASAWCLAETCCADDWLPRVCGILRRTCGYGAVWIGLEHDGEGLRRVAFDGHPIDEPLVVPHESVAYTALIGGAGSWVCTVDPKGGRDVGIPSLPGHRAAVVVIPGTKAVGCICLYDGASGAFGVAEIGALKNLAQQIGRAIGRPWMGPVSGTAPIEASRAAVSQPSLAEVLNSLPFMVRLTDETGRTVMANSRWARAQFVDGPLERVPRREMNRGVPRTRDDGGADDAVLWEDIEVQQGNGTSVEASWFTRRLEGGTTLEVVEVTDERRRTERLLRRSETKLRAIFDILPAGLAILDHDRNIVEMNPALESTVGIPRAELLQGTFRLRRFLAADGAPLSADQLPSTRAVATRTAVRNLEVGVVQHDGSTRWVSVSAAPLALPGMAAVVIATNVDDRRHTEDELRRKEEAIRLITDSVPAMIAALDGEGRYEFANRAYAKRLGLVPSELVGRSYREILGSRAAEALSGRVGRALAGRRADFEIHRTTEAGDVHWLSATYVPRRDALGRPMGFLALLTDVTRRRVAEESLRAANHRLRVLSRRMLEVQERERRAVARELHDEIGQILTAVKIDLQATRKRPLPQDLRARVEENLATVDRCLQQVRNLSLELRPPILDDLGLVAALRWHVARQAERGRFRVSLSEPALPVRLDPELETGCFRIVQEALTNIIRHAGAHSVRLEIRAIDDMLDVVIQDDGRGFDVASAVGSSKEIASLGLLSMQERAGLLGGRLAIESGPGGTRVEARLPLRTRTVRASG